MCKCTWTGTSGYIHNWFSCLPFQMLPIFERMASHEVISVRNDVEAGFCWHDWLVSPVTSHPYCFLNSFWTGHSLQKWQNSHTQERIYLSNLGSPCSESLCWTVRSFTIHRGRRGFTYWVLKLSHEEHWKLRKTLDKTDSSLFQAPLQKPSPTYGLYWGNWHMSSWVGSVSYWGKLSHTAEKILDS